MRDEALFQSSVSREIPRSLRKRERILDTLHATQEGPQDTRPHVRGTLSFPPQLKKSSVSTLRLEVRVHSLASSEKESQRSYRTSEGAALTLKLEKNSRGWATI